MTAAQPVARQPVPPAIFAAAGLALVLWSGTAIANKIAVGYMDDMSAGVLRSGLAGVQVSKAPDLADAAPALVFEEGQDIVHD